MQDFTITLTGGWAIFAIGCIVYFIGGMLVEIGKLVEKKRKNKEK